MFSFKHELIKYLTIFRFKLKALTSVVEVLVNVRGKSRVGIFLYFVAGEKLAHCPNEINQRWFSGLFSFVYSLIIYDLTSRLQRRSQ